METGDICRCIAEARAERHIPSPITRLCKHPGNAEFALYFDKMRIVSVKRRNNETWVNALQKVVSGVMNCPIRVRHLQHVKDIRGIGTEMQSLFMQYLDTFPPVPPTPDELHLERAARHAGEVAQEATLERLRTERERKKRSREAIGAKDAIDPFGPSRATLTEGKLMICDGAGWTGGSVGAPSNALNAGGHLCETVDDPLLAERAKKAKGEPKAPWEPGYRTAAFAIGCTLHRLYLEGRKIVGIKELQDESEASGLSNQGIKNRGDAAGVQNMADPTARYRGGRGGGRRFEYNGWSCFDSSFIKAPRGHNVPLAMRWANPVKIKLTDEGVEWCAEWHAVAHRRGDCACVAFERNAVDAAIDNGPKARWEREVLEPWKWERENGAAISAAPGRARAAARMEQCSDVESTAMKPIRARMDERTSTRRGVRTADEFSSMSITELKHMLELARIQIAGCSEKSELVELAFQHCASAAALANPGERRSDDEVICIEDSDNDYQKGCERVADHALVRAQARTPSSDLENVLLGHAPRLPTLLPGQRFGDVYDVVLVVDQRENMGGRTSRVKINRDVVTALCLQHDIRACVMHMEIGDATWVARKKDGARVGMLDAGDGCGDCQMLDAIVERKRLDDLSTSIRDSRYPEQKYHLKSLGLRGVSYLVEGDFRHMDRFDRNEASGRAVKSATVQTEAQDGFEVIRTFDTHDTLQLYARMTRALADMYAHLTRDDSSEVLCDVSTCPNQAADWDFVVKEEVVLMPPTLREFNQRMKHAKQQKLTVKNVWGSMLMQVSGLGVEIATAIIKRYPTPGHLRRAYVRCMPDSTAAEDLLATLPSSKSRTVGNAVSRAIFTQLFGFVFTPAIK